MYVCVCVCHCSTSMKGRRFGEDEDEGEDEDDWKLVLGDKINKQLKTYMGAGVEDEKDVKKQNKQVSVVFELLEFLRLEGLPSDTTPRNKNLRQIREDKLKQIITSIEGLAKNFKVPLQNEKNSLNVQMGRYPHMKEVGRRNSDSNVLSLIRRKIRLGRSHSGVFNRPLKLFQQRLTTQRLRKRREKSPLSRTSMMGKSVLEQLQERSIRKQYYHVIFLNMNSSTNEFDYWILELGKNKKGIRSLVEFEKDISTDFPQSYHKFVVLSFSHFIPQRSEKATRFNIQYKPLSKVVYRMERQRSKQTSTPPHQFKNAKGIYKYLIQFVKTDDELKKMCF